MPYKNWISYKFLYDTVSLQIELIELFVIKMVLTVLYVLRTRRMMADEDMKTCKLIIINNEVFDNTWIVRCSEK